MIEFSVKTNLPLSAKQLEAHIFNPENWTTFKGYGLIPGIESVRKTSAADGEIGSRFEVTNTDGSRHVETIVAFESGSLIKMKMDEFPLPLSGLASHFIETWDYTETEEGIELVRSFELYPRNFLGTATLNIVSTYLKRAIRIHLEVIRNDVN